MEGGGTSTIVLFFLYCSCDFKEYRTFLKFLTSTFYSMYLSLGRLLS